MGNVSQRWLIPLLMGDLFNNRRSLGDTSEQIARQFLKKRKHRILEVNFMGPNGEIDIISQDRGDLVFTEVRSKSSESFGTPEETIDLKKQERIKKTAQYYLLRHNITDHQLRFDVIALVWQGETYRMRYYEDAFR